MALTQTDKQLILSAFGPPETANRIIALLELAGTGNMTGPASSTDNALPRFDGITGALLQNSGLIVDDSNNLSGIATTAYVTQVAPTSPAAGSLKLYFKNDGLLYSKNSSGTETPIGSGGGDVAGPASSTNNAVARFDLATGKLLKNSALTVDDNGLSALTGTMPDEVDNFAGANYQFNTTAGTNPTSVTGLSLTLGAGYNGNGGAYAARIKNEAESSTPLDLYGPDGNYTVLAEAYATAGEKVAVHGYSFGGSKVLGTSGLALGADAAGVALGMYGAAQEPTGGVVAGGYFKLNTSDSVLGVPFPAVSGALIADNGDTTQDILVLQDNGTTKLHMFDGGRIAHATTILAGQCGYMLTITPPANGGGSSQTKGFEVRITSGYDGSDLLRAANLVNQSISTGYNLGGPLGGIGARCSAQGDSATAVNISVVGESLLGIRNIGVSGHVLLGRAAASTNVGVQGLAVNDGARTVGFYAKVSNTDSNLFSASPGASAAALFDNDNSALPIALFQTGGSTVAQVSATGQVRAASLGVANSVAATVPGTVTKKIQIFDASGASLGFIAVYDAIV